MSRVRAIVDRAQLADTFGSRCMAVARCHPPWLASVMKLFLRNCCLPLAVIVAATGCSSLQPVAAGRTVRGIPADHASIIVPKAIIGRQQDLRLDLLHPGIRLRGSEDHDGEHCHIAHHQAELDLEGASPSPLHVRASRLDWYAGT